MQIIIHPIANLPGQPGDAVTVAGDTITVNGTPFDLSPIPEGGEGTAHGDHPFAGVIRRTGGVLIVPLALRYDTATAASDQPIDPDHWAVTITSGALTDRIARIPEPEADA
jgi:hypothetical protein